MLTLEGAQAGLSWSTILRKRDGYRRCFAEFDPAAVARFTAKDVERLLADPAIVRNRLKVESTVDNAARVLEVQEAEGSLDAYLWGFVDGEPIVNHRRTMSELPAETPLSHLPEGPWLVESPRQTLLVRLVAVAALLVTLAYLAWRLNGTIAMDVWWLAVPLFVVEVHNAFGLALYTFALWKVDHRPPWRRVTDTSLRVAVLIPTYNEPAEVLMPTIVAAVALRPAHETWVLDDGGRETAERFDAEAQCSDGRAPHEQGAPSPDEPGLP